jgi:hypothetical protein
VSRIDEDLGVETDQSFGPGSVGKVHGNQPAVFDDRVLQLVFQTELDTLLLA